MEAQTSAAGKLLILFFFLSGRIREFKRKNPFKSPGGVNFLWWKMFQGGIHLSQETLSNASCSDMANCDEFPATRFEDNEAIRHQKQLNGNDWGEEEGHRSSAERQHGNHRELQEECRFHGWINVNGVSRLVRK